MDVVNGENDFFYCGGDCGSPTNLAAEVQPFYFPAASNGSQYFLVPGAGHNINMHFKAELGWEHMNGFLKTNGF